ncbi:MAG TPA: cell wall hydrolase [Candidatus Mediterraneibacter intestinigallinarum]|nr:cell wall hydrolase [Candidatus Mediterraneibacter intestinigallinarum]
MKYNQNRRIFRAFYAAAASMTLLTGFTSLAAETDMTDDLRSIHVQSASEMQTETFEDANETDDNAMLDDLAREEIWNFTEIVNDVQRNAVNETKTAAQEAYDAYLKKVEEEKRAAEEAARAAREQAVRESEQELLAALIFCEAGNQPYDGQVAVGAVVMNRVRSGSFPNTITDVIYQSGQFTPAMTGWLDSVLASDGYTDSAMQAAADALSGSNPIGDCLYFSTGGGGYQLGDHYFR